MPRYAANTEVSTDRSRTEIERTLERYGASRFSYGWDGDRAVIAFAAHDRLIRFVLPLPDRTAIEFTRHARSPRTPEAARQLWEQACRQRWRALALAVKAKLEAVECGIATFEEEFLAYIVLPDKSTVGQFMVPQVQRAYETGQLPALLPMLALPAGRE